MRNTPPNRGRRRDQDAKRRILQAALELLDEVGFANTTVERIAERSATGKATIYRWWPDKTAVIGDALRGALPDELPFPHTGDLQQDLRTQLRNVFRLLQGHRGRVLKAFTLAAQHDAQVAAIFHTVWWEARRHEARIGLQKYQDNLLRKNVDLEVVLDAMYGPICCRLLVGTNCNSTDYADSLADILFSGIANR